MEEKKTKKANLETKRNTWLLLGGVVVLSCMFVAFEWTQRDIVVDLSGRPIEPVFVEDMVPITMPDQPAPPPVPEPVAVETITVVDNEKEEKGEVASTEADKEGVTDIIYIPLPPEKDDILEPDFFLVVEDMPYFPGGESALMNYMAKNIKYPVIPLENNVQGRVVVQFIVDVDGSIVDPVIARSVDPHLDKEALRVVMAMPKWKPGMQRGKAVRVKYTVPVTFKLQ